MPAVDLNDGDRIPQLGLGVFQIPSGEETERAVATALEIGYRHFDTAQAYRNERGVGRAIAASGLDRSEVFVTSKLSNAAHEPDQAREAFARALEELEFEYIDLFLIHWPLPTLYGGDFVSTWRTLEEFKAEGRARSIGVSNFEIEHLKRLADETGTAPAVNQIELHPYLQNARSPRTHGEHGIAVEAWAPIAKAKILGEPALARIAGRHGRTVPQVVLRWHVQQGNIVFPKTSIQRACARTSRLRLRARAGRRRGDRGPATGRGSPEHAAPERDGVRSEVARDHQARAELRELQRRLDAVEREGLGEPVRRDAEPDECVQLVRPPLARRLELREARAPVDGVSVDAAEEDAVLQHHVDPDDACCRARSAGGGRRGRAGSRRRSAAAARARTP